MDLRCSYQTLDVIDVLYIGRMPDVASGALAVGANEGEAL
jgi:hypothetical protein